MIPVLCISWIWLLLATTVTAPPLIDPQSLARQAPEATSGCKPGQRRCGETLLSRGAFTVITLLCMAILGGLVGATSRRSTVACADMIRVSSTTTRPKEPASPVFRTRTHLLALHALHVFCLLGCSGQVWSRTVFTQYLS